MEKIKFKFLLTFLFVLSFSVTSHATIITINPTADGSIYTCPDCNPVSDQGYVLVDGYIQGVVKFSTVSIPDSVSEDC
jgi:hypothetical protein